MFLGYERTYADMGRTVKLHTVESKTFLLWGNSAIHCTTVPHVTISVTFLIQQTDSSLNEFSEQSRLLCLLMVRTEFWSKNYPQGNNYFEENTNKMVSFELDHSSETHQYSFIFVKFPFHNFRTGSTN